MRAQKVLTISSVWLADYGESGGQQDGLYP